MLSFAVGPLSLGLCFIFQLNSLQTWILSMLSSPTQKSGYIMWYFLQIFTVLHGIFHPPFLIFLCSKENLFLTTSGAVSFVCHQCLSDGKSVCIESILPKTLYSPPKEGCGQPAPGRGTRRSRGLLHPWVVFFFFPSFSVFFFWVMSVQTSWEDFDRFLIRDNWEQEERKKKKRENRRGN